MLIRDLERKTGLERATIRFYEKEGFLDPQRKENGYREYSQEDCDTLLKIKLLRQLGMSLDTIRALQQGTGDFSAALTDQIRALGHQIQTASRAKDICEEMRDSGVKYETLDAAHYLELLSRPYSRSVPALQTKAVPEFHMKREVHPVRRFAARYLDYNLLALTVQFILYVVIRVRPAFGFLNTLVDFGCWFLMIPVGAFLLHKFGTTPGKWAMGIRMESCNGGYLSMEDAMDREWWLLRQGLGLGIPGWQTWRLWKSYKAYLEDEKLEWDENSEIIFHKWGFKRKAAAAGLCAVWIGLILFTVSDGLKPKYRGDLTVAHFAENYNDFLETYYENSSDQRKMLKDGTWEEDPYGTYTLYIGGEPDVPNADFTYSTENGYIRSISYENGYKDAFMVAPVPSQCKNAVMTLLLSQKGSSYWDLVEFEELMDEQSDQASGSVQFENIEINWISEAENCEFLQGCYYRIDEEAESRVEIFVEIIIHET